MVAVRIVFHGPFRVGTGLSAPGVRQSVDPADLLPASSLKGLMRASAARLLPARADVVDEVFGLRHADRAADPARPGGAHRRRGWDGSSPWHWSGAHFHPNATPADGDAAPTDPMGPDSAGDRVRITPRARIAIDPASGAARRDFLAIGDEVWARGAAFTIERTGHLTADELLVHRTVLACAAAGVHALGADRRRGLGWVTFRPTGPAIDDALLARFSALRRAAAEPEGGAPDA